MQLNLLIHIATREVNCQTDDSHKGQGDEDLPSHLHEEDEGLKEDNKDRSTDPNNNAAPWQILRLPHAPHEAKEQDKDSGEGPDVPVLKGSKELSHVPTQLLHKHIATHEVNPQKGNSYECQSDEHHPSHSR